MPLISIIVPIYNAEKEVKRCIDSIIHQYDNDFEILLINDGSTDNSAEICEELWRINPSIRYFSQTNQGVSVARNVGIAEARGQWIVFVDSDDIVAPNMCSLIRSSIDDNTDLILFDYKEFRDESVRFSDDEAAEYEIYCYSSKDKTALQKKAFGYTKELPEIKTSLRTPWAKAYKNRFLKDFNLKYEIDIRIGEDFLFNLRVLDNIMKIKYIKTNVYYYCYNSNSTIHKYKPDIEKIDRGFYCALDSIMNDLSNRDDLIMSYNASVLDGLLLYMQYYYFHKDNLNSIYFIKKDIQRLISSSPYKNALNNLSREFLKEYFPLSKRIVIHFIRMENVEGLKYLYRLKKLLGSRKYITS